MRHIILANWKMTPGSPKEAKDLFDATKLGIGRMRSVNAILAVPAIYIASLKNTYKGNKLDFCAQSISAFEDKSHTGEISALQYKNIGAEYCLIGHSETTDTLDDLRIKTFLAVKYGLSPIVFIGEDNRDASGKYLQTIREQLKSALKELSHSQINNVIFCYEPVWAIGKRVALEPYDVHQMALFLRKILVEEYGAGIARKAKILYGGSVNTDNIANILTIDDIDGVAVGRVSTDKKAFIDLLALANKV